MRSRTWYRKAKICTFASAGARGLVNAQWARRAAASGRPKQPGPYPYVALIRGRQGRTYSLSCRMLTKPHPEAGTSQADAGSPAQASPHPNGFVRERLSGWSGSLPHYLVLQRRRLITGDQGAESLMHSPCCSVKFQAGSTSKDQGSEGSGEP